MSAEITNYLDTGSYTLNALLSGETRRGLAGNRITALAGDSGCGKTLISLAAAKQFLESDPNAIVWYFDTEQAVGLSMLQNLGIDNDRFVIAEIARVEDFQTQAVRLIEEYRDQDPSEKMPLMLILDSLGNLTTEAELQKARDANHTADMGLKAKLIKATFRVLTTACGQAGVPLIVTNHTYDTPEMFSKKVMTGGTGLVYTASTIVFFHKSQLKDGKDHIGIGLRASIEKGRVTRFKSEGHTRVLFDSGLDRYAGLVDLAVEGGVWVQAGPRIEVDGKKLYRKEIESNPEKYFTDDVLDKIDEWTRKKYLYGSTAEDVDAAAQKDDDNE